MIKLDGSVTVLEWLLYIIVLLGLVCFFTGLLVVLAGDVDKLEPLVPAGLLTLLFGALAVLYWPRKI